MSTSAEPEYIEQALTMPCDRELLPALGRVAWAAIRLQHGVRDLRGSEWDFVAVNAFSRVTAGI